MFEPVCAAVFGVEDAAVVGEVAECEGEVEVETELEDAAILLVPPSATFASGLCQIPWYSYTRALRTGAISRCVCICR